MDAQKRIIDRDIDQYTADIEHHSALLLRCASGQEWKHRQRMNSAAAVLSALRVYHEALRDSA